jgi:endonuclease-3 related protein
MPLNEVYRRLYEAFGPQHWWPGDSPIEVVVGAVLVQNTSWANVEKALHRLREAELLDPHALLALPAEELEEYIRSAGYYRVKARRLLNLMQYLVDRFDGSLETMFRTPLAELREDLLHVNGVGPETADSILLYAGQLPTFVVDTYTYRVFTRHGWIEPEADYEQLQNYCQSQLPDDAQLFNEFHALLVRLGKDYCRKTSPRCAQCPLRELLPPGGPLGEEGS